MKCTRLFLISLPLCLPSFSPLLKAADPHDGIWELHLDQVRGGKAPVTLLLDRKNGSWQRAAILAPFYNVDDTGNFNWDTSLDASSLTLSANSLGGSLSATVPGSTDVLNATLTASVASGKVTGTYSGTVDGKNISAKLRGRILPRTDVGTVRRILVNLHTPYPGHNNNPKTSISHLSATVGVVFTSGSASSASIGGRSVFTWFGANANEEASQVEGADAFGRDRSFLFSSPQVGAGGAPSGSISGEQVNVTVPFDGGAWIITGQLFGNHFFGSYQLQGDPGHSNRAAGYVSWMPERTLPVLSFQPLQTAAADPNLAALAAAEGSSFAGPYFESITDYDLRLKAHLHWLYREPATVNSFAVPLLNSSATGTGNKNYDNSPMNGSAAAMFGSRLAMLESDPDFKAELLDIARAGGHYLIRRGEGPYRLPTYYKGDVWFAAWMGPAFLDLFDATGDQEWMDRAVEFAQLLQQLQQPSGTWTWVDEDSGAIGVSNERNDRSWDNLDLQFAEFLYFLGRLRTQYNNEDFAAVETAAYDWLKAAVPADPVHNGRNYLWLDRRPGTAKDALGPTFYALYLLDYATQVTDAQLEEIISIAESEFIQWTRSTGPGMQFLPKVDGFAPRESIGSGFNGVDPAATMRMALVFLKLYQRTGKDLDLARAKALCESVLAMQRSNGLIWANPALPDDPIAYTQQDNGHEYRIYYVDLAVNLQRFYDEMLAIGQIDGRPWARAANVDVFDTDVDEQEAVTLDGSQSQDIDGSITSYEWKLEDGTPLGSGVTLQQTFGLGIHPVRLIVTDNDGKKGSVLIYVKIRTVPEPPVVTQVTADPDEVGKGGFTTLRVIASDPNPLDILSYEWEKQSGPGTVTFSVNNSPYASTPLVTFTQPGSYELQVTARDPEDLTDSGTVTVVVTNTPHPGPFRYLKVETDRSNRNGAAKMHVAELHWVEAGVKYPTLPMTSNTHPFPLVAQQSTGDPGYELYDADLDVTWGYTSATIESVTLDLGAGNFISPSETIMTVTDATGRRPLHVAFYGSADGESYTLLYDSRVPHPAGVPWQIVNTFPLSATVTPAVVIQESDDSSELTEGGGADTLGVRLNSEPSAPVTVTVNPDAQYTVNGSSSPVDLVFTAANWSTEQQLTLLAVDDAVEEPSPQSVSLTFGVASSDGDYDGMTVPAVTVVVTDDDGPIPPVANAGSDRIVVDEDDTGSETVPLDGSASSDPDGTIASYAWSWSGGTATGVNPSPTFPVGTTTVTLTVTDNDGTTAQDMISITVQGPGGGTGPHIEAAGLIVIEAEHFTTNPQNTDPTPWQAGTTLQGFVGTGYVVSPETSGNKQWPETPAALTYPLSVSSAGTYTVWVRRNSSGGSGNSFHLGLDGVLVIDGADNNGSDTGLWVWRNVGTVTLPAGSPVLEIRRRERERYGLDRIVLTKDGTVTPAGDGPPESLRQENQSEFETFMEGFPSLNGPQLLPYADPEGDRISNLYEFAFVLAADQVDGAEMLPAAMKTEVNNETYLALTYRRRTGGSGTRGVDYTVDGIQYVVEVSQDLQAVTWQSGATHVQPVGSPAANGDGSEEVVVRMNLPVTAMPQGFMRLNVVQAN